MDDVIGTAPDPRRRGPARLRALPGTGTPRGRRVLAAVAAVAVTATVVTLGRAGLDPAGTPGAAPPDTRPVLGTLLQLAAGQDTLYALVEDCRAAGPCRVALLSSRTDGRTWRELPPPDDPATTRTSDWVMRVSGVGDQLSVEDPGAGVVHVGTTSFTTEPIVDGPPRTQVPAQRESLVRLCAAAPRCGGDAAVEYLDPLTGVRSRLATQPPFPPTVLAVEGPQLWVAGIDPATRRYAVAVSTDDGSTWRSAPLPDVPADTGPLVPRLVPVPEQNLAYLVLAEPGAGGAATLAELWSVPDPQTGYAPREVRPTGGALSFGSAVGLRDGRLALAGGVPAVVASDGVVDRAAPADPGAVPPMPYQHLQRGPRSQVVAEAVPAPRRESPEKRTQVRLVVSATGAPDGWELRPVTLPR